MAEKTELPEAPNFGAGRAGKAAPSRRWPLPGRAEPEEQAKAATSALERQAQALQQEHAEDKHRAPRPLPHQAGAMPLPGKPHKPEE